MEKEKKKYTGYGYIEFVRMLPNSYKVVKL